jgi:CHAT domain/Alpha/beta hydrolase family/AAA domain
MIAANLVLIHGFWSSTGTWKKLERCFHNDPELAGVKVHPFGYESPKLRLPFSPIRIPDYDDVAQTLASELSVRVPDGDIAIVTHSQGGLILQRFLAWMLNEGRGRELARIQLIVMLACPNEGSEYLRSLRAAAGFGRHPQARELKTLNADAAEALRTVQQRIVNAQGCNEHKCKIPIYVYSGRTDNVVPRTSAQSVFPNVGALPGDHSSILDPDAPDNITFDTLKKHLLAAFTDSAVPVPDESLRDDDEQRTLSHAASTATESEPSEASAKPEIYTTSIRNSSASPVAWGVVQDDSLIGKREIDGENFAPAATPILRILDRVVDGLHEITISWHPATSTAREAKTKFAYLMDESDILKIRWYLEDYLEFPVDPAPTIAADAEVRLSAIGRELFAKTFNAPDRNMIRIWSEAVSGPGGLTRVRVEVDADPTDVPGIPWELLRDPATDRPVALAAKEFVRTHRLTARPIKVSEPRAGPLRALFVISRPGGRVDVPLRSVASRLIRGGAEQMYDLDLDVLRPPTYRRLAQVLRAAAEAGRPYDIVHFDGHGTYLDVAELRSDRSYSLAQEPLPVAGAIRTGGHGYLVFEDPAAAENQQLVDGSTLAALLAETDVPVLVLNACRTAYAEAPGNTGQGSGEDSTATAVAAGEPLTSEEAARGGTPVVAGAPEDVHTRVRAFGSMAAEVADAGIPGVVAMRYNVYVVTAAQFSADLYAHLLKGKTFGHAASSARRALADDPMRLIIRPTALQDWTVPVVYECYPLPLIVPSSKRQQLLRIGDDSRPGDPSTSRRSSNAIGLPRPPDLGFFGRDETVLALDRAFDTHQLLLLHGDAGAGKSAMAAEFARWYQATGGLDYAEQATGPVICTSFAQHRSLAEILDATGRQLASLVDAERTQWQVISDADACRDAVLRMLSQVPVIWIWDSIEHVAGFPIGTPSAWSGPEQDELADFLRDLKNQTLARVLLVSRYDEQLWLGNLPMHIALPQMTMRDSIQLARALATRRGGANAAETLDWRPLLRYIQGNPLRINVLVAQALSQGLSTTEEIEQFTARLRAAESAEEPGSA